MNYTSDLLIIGLNRPCYQLRAISCVYKCYSSDSAPCSADKKLGFVPFSLLLSKG